MSETAIIASGSDLHCMVDLETAGVGNSAGLVQCGIVSYDPDAEPGTFVGGSEQEWNINLMSSLMYGGEIEPGTLDFWRKRPDQWPALTSNACTIPFLLDMLDVYFMTFKPSRIWCHGATFDVPILGGYYARAGRPTPWRYSAVRCTRTLYENAEKFANWQRTQIETAHLGLADAKAQAKDAQECYQALRALKLPA